jgi:ABC-type branched-subunit amino acid transport system ATPase component/ABC-type branched-subunit amino acid transport system permease subunit
MKRTLGIATGVAVLVLLPLPLSSYQLGLATKMLIFALFAMSLNLILGYAGLPSLGHAAYFGVGAYTVGLLAVRVVDNFWLDFGAGLLAAGVTSALFGLLALRARGAYLLMITLALAQVLWGIAFGWRWLTGGDDGLPGVPRPGAGLPWSLSSGPSFYYFVLVVFVVATAALWVIVRSPFGAALVGIRESERRMQVLGYNTWLYKYVAFVLAGLIAGVSGNLFVYYNGFVSPAYLSIVFSAMALIMVILGGAGTLLGPALGSAAIVFLENVISASTERWLTVLGLIYVAVTLFAPAGIMGWLLTWGAPIWPPIPPNARSTPAKPGRSSILRQAPSSTHGVSALTVEGLSHDFGGLRALDAVSFEVAEGERLVILGPNGAGKTTLFNLVTGLFPPTAGRIALFGRDVTRLAPHRRARLGLGRTFQITTLFPRLTVLESVLLAVQGADRARFTLHRPLAAFPRLFARAERLLDEWSLAERRDVLTRQLSYGEQRQLELLLALAGEPKVLLLDEPTAGLSPAETASVAGLIRRFPRDVTILLIEHDMDVALELAERVIVFHYGRVVAAGPRDEIRKDARVAEIYLGIDEA